MVSFAGLTRRSQAKTKDFANRGIDIVVTLVLGIVLTFVWFLMAVGSQTAWCLMGKYMRKFATSDKFIKNFNYTMSFLLIVCVIMFYV